MTGGLVWLAGRQALGRRSFSGLPDHNRLCDLRCDPALWRSCQSLLNRDDQFRELRRRGRKSARRGRVEDPRAIGQMLPVRHVRNCNLRRQRVRRWLILRIRARPAPRPCAKLRHWPGFHKAPQILTSSSTSRCLAAHMQASVRNVSIQVGRPVSAALLTSPSPSQPGGIRREAGTGYTVRPRLTGPTKNPRTGALR